MKRKLLAILGSLFLAGVLIGLLFLTACSSNTPAPSTTAPTTAAPTSAAATSSTAAPTKPAATTSAPAASQPITIKALTAFPKASSTTDFMKNLAERVKQRSNGQLIINWVGGPEVIPANDQVPAVKDGVIDLVQTPFSYTEKALPISGVGPLTQFPVSEERQRGAYDFWVEQYSKMGVRYLGMPHYPQNYFMFLKTAIKNPRTDFKGMKIRSGVIYDPFIVNLGGVPVTVQTPEVYSALERGVVNGAGWVPDQFAANKGQEVTKFWIEVPFYRTAIGMLMNTARWTSLSKDNQDLVLDVIKQLELEGVQAGEKMNSDYFEQFKKAGMQPINFSAEDAKWFYDLAYSSKWDDMKSVLSADQITQAKKILSK